MIIVLVTVTDSLCTVFSGKQLEALIGGQAGSAAVFH
jgi:hypothetical protein